MNGPRPPRPPPPTVEQAKFALLAEDLALAPGRLAGDWARRHAVQIAFAAGAAGILLTRSRLLRRLAVAALLAPALRREVRRGVLAAVSALLARR